MRSSTQKQHLNQLHELQIRREQVQAAIDAIERLEHSWAVHASLIRESRRYLESAGRPRLRQVAKPPATSPFIQTGSSRSTIESVAC